MGRMKSKTLKKARAADVRATVRAEAQIDPFAKFGRPVPANTPAEVDAALAIALPLWAAVEEDSWDEGEFPTPECTVREWLATSEMVLLLLPDGTHRLELGLADDVRRALGLRKAPTG